jgi:hypothetical protein
MIDDENLRHVEHLGQAVFEAAVEERGSAIFDSGTQNTPLTVRFTISSPTFGGSTTTATAAWSTRSAHTLRGAFPHTGACERPFN